MAPNKRLPKADQQLWAAFTQTILPLPGKPRPTINPPVTPPLEILPSQPTPNGKPHPKPPAQTLQTNTPPAGLDKSTWQKFASGKRRADQKLDLHGLTATRAHTATLDFIHHAYSTKTRCIEIVTGNGEILARELPHWLNSPPIRPLILATAHPNRANTGAIRILLRRPK